MKRLSLLDQSGIRQVLYAAIVLGCLGTAQGLAETDIACSDKQTKISGLNFEHGSLVFQDAADINYIAANIVIADIGAFSATIRTQITNQITKQVMDFSGLMDQSIARAFAKPDRYGRLVVNVYANSGQQWLQWDLVNAGLVLVRPQGGLDCIKQLLVAEAAARSNKVGIWQFPEIVMVADEVNWKERVQSYQLVEGIIASVGKTNSKYYLNFSDNWNEDLTVIVAKTNFKRFKRAYGDLEQLTGKKVRIRGWMIQNRGPMIELYHPGQIEIDIE